MGIHLDTDGLMSLCLFMGAEVSKQADSKALVSPRGKCSPKAFHLHKVSEAGSEAWPFYCQESTLQGSQKTGALSDGTAVWCPTSQQGSPDS